VRERRSVVSPTEKLYQATGWLRLFAYDAFLAGAPFVADARAKSRYTGIGNLDWKGLRDPIQKEEQTMLLKMVKIQLNLPWVGEIAGMWEPDEVEAKAAWELYVELITRVSVVELKPGEGLLREALNSLYSLVKTTREILRQYGPSVGKPKGLGKLSFGFLSVAVLNTVLRPVLS